MTRIRRKDKSYLDHLQRKGHALDQPIRVMPSGRVYVCADVALSYGQDVDADFTFMVIQTIGFHAGLCNEAEFMQALAIGRASPTRKLIDPFSQAQGQGVMHYYDLKRNWRKVNRHPDNPALNDVLVREFNKFTFGRWLEPFKLGIYPAEFDL